jgi:hypothetical protein
MDMSAIEGFAITLYNSYSKDEGSPDPYHSSSKSSFLSREVSID